MKLVLIPFTVRGRLVVLGLLVSVMLALVLVGGSALAQGPQVRIERAALQLWPEYDDPGLLVIFSGVLTGALTFPQPVAFPLPAGARDIQATFEDASGGLINQPWQIADGKLTYSLPNPNFHVEYYLDRPAQAVQRELSYVFEAPYPVQTMDVVVQQPLRSTGFSVSPQPDGSFVGSDGLTYYRLGRTGLAAGDRLPLTIRYSKTDQGVSAPRVSVPATGPNVPPVSASGASAGGWGNIVAYVLIGAGLIGLAVTGAYWYGQRRAASSAAVTRRPGPREPGSRPAAFCTQCGQPLQPGDRFCARCGAPRRA